jgi:tetratricopeptide (TPR) repeat protein
MLHGDIAMLAPASERPANGDSAPVLQRLTLYMTDGRQVGLQDAVSHWEMGRWLLDRVRPEGKAPPNKLFPGPESDPVVRLWYLATSAYMQSLMQLDPVHFERELELFPKDPDVLFFAGALHETFASPRIQAALRQMKVPRGVTFDVQSEGAEFRLAEQLYRRALEANPGMVEARIRLGRVLGKRGRQLEALEQLRQAISKTTEPVLQYYCGLFLGAAAEALGHEDEARRSYQRAASLYPMAQSPMLALSRLAAQSGNREAAREGIGQVLTMPAEQDLRNDPWWTYDVSHARNLEMLLADLYRRF